MSHIRRELLGTGWAGGLTYHLCSLYPVISSKEIITNPSLGDLSPLTAGDKQLSWEAENHLRGLRVDRFPDRQTDRKRATTPD